MPHDETNVIGKIFAADASRIYISQMTDVDANFGLPATNHGLVLDSQQLQLNLITLELLDALVLSFMLALVHSKRRVF